MSRDILSGLPDATRGEIISFMTFFKGERARTLEALDGDFEDCLEDRIRGVDPPFSLEDVTSAVDHLQVVVKDTEPDDRYVPSVDRLFETAAKKLGEQCIGVVLTGMGDDGADGVLHIARRGGRVLAESPESAVIYGMPGAAERTGVVTAMLPLETLAERLVMWLR